MNLEFRLTASCFGLGCDVIEVARIRSVCERQGERFLARVFTDEERAYCSGMTHPHKHLAARFAAKEAVSKCFTTGIGAELSWNRSPSSTASAGSRSCGSTKKGAALLQHLGATQVLVSLSHTETLAMAVAALVR